MIIDHLAEYKYDPKSKYESMWTIIRLGNLFDKILPEKTIEGVTLKTLDQDISGRKLCLDLNSKQQWCLFKITRNICSDFFHIMYEQSVKEFLGQVSMLCQGQNICDSLAGLSRQYTKFSRGKDLEKLLKVDKPMQTKLFNQTGYFLIRAHDFFQADNIPAACMALLGASNCARFVFISKMKGDQELLGVAELFEMRGLLSHNDLSRVQEEKMSSTIKLTCGALEENIVKLQADARKLDLAVDANAYKQVEKAKEDDESPRGLPKGLF